MGVALPSLAILAETQNLEAQLLSGPVFFPFSVLSCCLCFLLSSFFALFFFFLQWSKGADHGMGAGLEDKAPRAAKNNMGCSTASGHRRIRLKLPEAPEISSHGRVCTIAKKNRLQAAMLQLSARGQ